MNNVIPIAISFVAGFVLGAIASTGADEDEE